jgi:hypothetical protein
MTDVRLRDAERRALSGSVEDQARALVARLRTAPGSPFRARVELAAYCGDKAARAAWAKAWGPNRGGPHRAPWLPAPQTPARPDLHLGLTPSDNVRAAARLAGEAPVLNAIRSSLIEWSLGGEK